MSKLAAALRALREGGVPELSRRTRRWIEQRREVPAPPAAKPASTGPAKPRASAMDVDHDAALRWFERRRATYERLATAVAPYVDPKGTVFDIGGNIGYFTKVLAETVDFRGTVHLFEPVPNLVALCSRTLAGAPYDVQVHNFGLGSENTSMDIYIGADGNLGWNTLVAEKANPEMRQVEIQIRTLRDSGVVDVPEFVKIDVEGAEREVIRGMLGPLREWPTKPVILCEIGWGKGHPHWEDEMAVLEELLAVGYRCVDLDGNPVDIAGLEKTTDVMFLPA